MGGNTRLATSGRDSQAVATRGGAGLAALIVLWLTLASVATPLAVAYADLADGPDAATDDGCDTGDCSGGSSSCVNASTCVTAREIQAKALDDHECNDTEWHFVINQISTPELAPTTVTVEWASGDVVEVALEKVTGGTAHYRTALHLDRRVTAATADIYPEWDGQFNLSHGPCFDASNQPPAPQDDTAVGEVNGAVDIYVLDNDADPDGDPLTVTSVTAPAHGTASINPDGSIRYVPDPDYTGDDAFTYTVDDGRQGSGSASVTVTVQAPGSAPVAVDDTARTVEDMGINVPVLANDHDVDGDALTVSDVGAPSLGAAVLEVDGTITYTPNADWSGTDAFTYTITDGVDGSSTAVVTVTVNAVNDPPVAAPDTGATDEDLAVDVPVLRNDDDVDGDALSVTGVTGVTNGVVDVLAGGVLRFTPTADWSGTEEFTYTVSDGEFDDSATVTVTVAPVNDPPVAVDDVATTSEDTPVDVAVLANDDDVDGDVLTVTAFTTPAHGTLSWAGDVATFTPNADFNGVDAFTYAVSDGLAEATATVTLTVGAVNDPPIAVDDVAATLEDEAVQVSVLGNDDDPDGDALSVTAFTAPANGVVEDLGNGAFLYRPSADYAGEDSFTYTITDGALTATATVRVTVDPVNDPPNVDFTYAAVPVYVRVVTDFTDLSTDLDGAIVAESWVFGDGSGAECDVTGCTDWDEHAPAQATGTGQDPTHAFATIGVFEVCLTATDDGGLTGEACRLVDVVPVPPDALFLFDPFRAARNEVVTFTDASTDPDGVIVAWAWDFGDGATATVQHPQHAFTAYGEFEVCLTVTDNDGAIDTECRGVPVVPPLLEGRGIGVKVELGPSGLPVGGADTRIIRTFQGNDGGRAFPVGTFKTDVADGRLAFGAVDMTNDVVTSHGRVADATFTLPTGDVVEVVGAQARTEVSCNGISGRSSVDELRVNGVDVLDALLVTGPEPRLTLGAYLTIAVNEFVPMGDGRGVTVNAVHIQVKHGIDIVVASAMGHVAYCEASAGSNATGWAPGGTNDALPSVPLLATVHRAFLADSL